MRTVLTRLLLVSLLLASTAAAQPPAPVVEAVSPSSGPTGTATLVAIHGSGLSLPPGFACILPCPTRVTFGEAAAELLVESNELLVVRAPARESGVVAVTITTGDGRTTREPAAFTYRSKLEAQYERLLLPIYLDGRVPGANGSLWDTDFVLRNNGPQDVVLAPWTCDPGPACPAVFPLTLTLKPGHTLHDLPAFFQPPSGNRSRIVYVAKPGLDSISAGLRLYDLSRGGQDAGTELPIVRDDDLRNEAVSLHGIAAGDGYRVTLRIYEMERDEAEFRVSVYRESTSPEEPVQIFEVRTTRRESGDFAIHSGYAETNAIGGLAGNHAYRVVVEPRSEGSRFWAFASTTSNETQRVTLSTPQ